MEEQDNTVAQSQPISAPKRAAREAEEPAAGERITYGEDGLLDEVSAGGAYLERMDDNSFFLTMERFDGSSVAVWLSSKKKLLVNIEERGPGPKRFRMLAGVPAPTSDSKHSEGGE